MGADGRYPQLVINTKKFRHNVRSVKLNADKAGVKIAGIVKGYWAMPELASIIAWAGVAQIGSSRLSQIESLQKQGIPGPYMLIRIPMLSEIHDVARLCDYSLESDISVLQTLNDECAAIGKKHKVLLMLDMGDLREGLWDKEMAIATAVHIEMDLDFLELTGIATFVGCYGSLMLTPEKLQEFVDIGEAIEDTIGRKLELMSAGGSNEYMMLAAGKLPERINHMRIGEIYSAPRGVFENYEMKLPYIYTDVFTFRAEIIEIEDKPSYPQGTIGKTAWGEEAVYVDRGIRKRAVLAFGRADVAEPARLLPRTPGMEFLGASSDHAIYDIQDCAKKLAVGDIIEFDLEYSTMLSLTGALDVEKIFTESSDVEKMYTESVQTEAPVVEKPAEPRTVKEILNENIDVKKIITEKLDAKKVAAEEREIRKLAAETRAERKAAAEEMKEQQAVIEAEQKQAAAEGKQKAFERMTTASDVKAEREAARNAENPNEKQLPTDPNEIQRILTDSREFEKVFGRKND